MVRSSPDHTKEEKVQDTWKEPLLCLDCDTRVIGRYEQYASQVLFHAKLKDCADPLDGRYQVITNLDYVKLKLFCMSLIWRMGVSSLPEFSVVQLGPHTEKLRKKILTGEPGRYYEYGCFLGGISFYNEPFLATLTPELIRKEGYHIYQIPICSFVFGFVVSNHADRFKYKDEFLRESGDWRIKKMDENHPFVQKLLKRMLSSMPINSEARFLADKL